MSELNLNERVALAKLVELSHPYLDPKILNWLSKMFDIKYGGIPSTFSHMYAFQKDDVHNYLTSVYTQYPDIFPKVMEEISRLILKEKLLRITETYEAHRKKVPRKAFLSVIGSHFASLSKYLEVLGYGLRVNNPKSTDFDDIQFVKREISEERKEERTKLSNILEKHFNDEYIALHGAYERYLDGGTNANRQAIDSCRNAYEHFFKKITKQEKWKEGLKEVVDSRRLIQLIKEVYSYLSGYGTHSKKERKKDDALLAIRLTEDIMIRILTEKGLW
jgi:hypothetical protein